MNNIITRPIQFEIKIVKLSKPVPSQLLNDFNDWLEAHAMMRGIGHHSEYYSYTNNYLDDICVDFYVEYKNFKKIINKYAFK